MWKRLVRTFQQYLYTTVTEAFKVIVLKTNQLTSHSYWRLVHFAILACSTQASIEYTIYLCISYKAEKFSRPCSVAVSK